MAPIDLIPKNRTVRSKSTLQPSSTTLDLFTLGSSSKQDSPLDTNSAEYDNYNYLLQDESFTAKPENSPEMESFWRPPNGFIIMIVVIVAAYAWYHSNKANSKDNNNVGDKSNMNESPGQSLELNNGCSTKYCKFNKDLQTLSEADLKDAEFPAVSKSIQEVSVTNQRLCEASDASISNAPSYRSSRIYNDATHNVRKISTHSNRVSKSKAKRKRRIPEVMQKCIRNDMNQKQINRTEVPITLDKLLSSNSLLPEYIDNE